MSNDKAVVLLLYRSILRWHRRIEAVPLQIRPSHIAELMPEASTSGTLRHDVDSNVLNLARRAFRQQLPAITSQALQLLNTEYAQAVRALQMMRLEHQNSQGIHHLVGTVFRHKKYGYKGVVYGWDRTCDRPPDWADAMKVNGNQPFYYVLPDEPDCERLFQSVRTSKYVAQENIEVLHDERVVHRAMMSYFTDYSPQLGRYIPNERTQYEYPGDYTASDAQSCQADSNLLLHEDPYPYTDPYADPYDDSPDSQHSQCPAEQAEGQAQATASSSSLQAAAASLPAGDADVEQTAAQAPNEDKPSPQGKSSDPALSEQNVGTDVKR